MASSVDSHKFNDDLPLHESDRKLAESKYPSIFHVLHHPELRQLFSEYDGPADRAKRDGLKAGLWAIGFGFAALAIAALEITVMHPSGGGSTAPNVESEEWLSIVLAVVSGQCLLGSVLIGSFGVLFASRKQDWLHSRLMGESIRQIFRFWYFVSRKSSHR